MSYMGKIDQYMLFALGEAILDDSSVARGRELDLNAVLQSCCKVAHAGCIITDLQRL